MPKTDPQMPWDLARFRNWVACGKVHQLVRKALSDGLTEVGLELPQYDVLSAAFRFPGLGQSELAEKLLVGRSNLSMLLPEMERKKWIRREPDESDRRIRRLYLTPKGEKLAAAGLQIQVNLVNHMSKAIDDDECDVIGDLMRRVGNYLEQNEFAESDSSAKSKP